MDNEPYVTIKTPLFVAKWSFIIGTLLFLAHFVLNFIDPHNNIIAITGFFFVVAAIVVNLIVFVLTIGTSLCYPEYQNQMVLNAFIQLANIPIAMLYLYIVVSFTN